MMSLLRFLACLPLVALLAACDPTAQSYPKWYFNEGYSLKACLDKVDNDQDGLMDCDDPDCAYFANCLARGPETSDQSCSDGYDNDSDGKTDCLDSSCQKMAVCATGETEDNDETCSDGYDNDGDGYIDCSDYSCSQAVAVTVCGVKEPENTNAACSDNKDNDNNGYIDCLDFGCTKNNPAVTVCWTENNEPEDTEEGAPM